MTLVVLRQATPADVPAILAMVRELAEFERLAHQLVATEAQFQAALFGAKPAAEAIVAEADGAVVGYALWFTTFSTFLGRPGIWLEDLYVRPAHRRRGIGRALLERVVAIGRERGCGRVEWSVLDWNADAIAVYAAFGAELLPDWRIMRVVKDGSRAPT